MRRNAFIRITAMLLALFIFSVTCFANSTPAGENGLVTTKHTAVIDGKKISYNATAGKMLIDDDLGQYEIYFNAYTKRGVSDKSKRPITFVFNGGPGSASLWLHVGCLGPERLDLDKNGMVKKIPTTTKANPYSILDITDLVFIDPVGTGYSRTVGDTDPNIFYSYSGDIISVSDFISRYISKYGRWSSPKYIIGESYGTVRAVGASQYLLSQYHIALNGMILISTANDFSAIMQRPGNDNYYVNYIASFAATARYHKKLSKTYQNMKLETFLDKVKEFASGEYLSALYKGNHLGSAEKKSIAKKLSSFIGLPEETILNNNLRIDLETFCKGLLADDKLMVGRMDSRYTGAVTNGSLLSGESDPSSLGTSEAFTSAYLDYASNKLGYTTDEKYEVLSLNINSVWNYQLDNDILSQQDDIADIMSKNPAMKVWVTCGYYDLATPYSAAEWVYSHVDLGDAIKNNLSFTYYKSGHMFYANESSLKQFRKDAAAWFRS